MYVGKDFTPKLLWHFARKNLLRTLLISLIACVLYKIIGWEFVGISFLPVATIGTAVAFYVGFKNNQAYDGSGRPSALGGPAALGRHHQHGPHPSRDGDCYHS